MALTALALGYPANKPLRTSPNMSVLSLTGLGYSPAVPTLGAKKLIQATHSLFTFIVALLLSRIG